MKVFNFSFIHRLRFTVVNSTTVRFKSTTIERSVKNASSCRKGSVKENENATRLSVEMMPKWLSVILIVNDSNKREFLMGNQCGAQVQEVECKMRLFRSPPSA